MWSEFKKFAFKGSVIDMAVGVMIGTAFGKITASLVADIFMPLISLLTGSVDFANMFVALDGGSYATLAEAKEAGAACFAYGNFVTTILDFLLIAICVFIFVKLINKLRELGKKKEEEKPEPRKCPFCMSEIDEKATRCPHCTSKLPEKE